MSDPFCFDPRLQIICCYIVRYYVKIACAPVGRKRYKPRTVKNETKYHQKGEKLKSSSNSLSFNSEFNKKDIKIDLKKWEKITIFNEKSWC